MKEWRRNSSTLNDQIWITILQGLVCTMFSFKWEKDGSSKNTYSKLSGRGLSTRFVGDSEFSSATIAMNSSNSEKISSSRRVPSMEWRILLPLVDIKDHSFSPNSKIELFLFNSNNCISSVKKRTSQDEENFAIVFHFENNETSRKNFEEFVDVFMSIGFGSAMKLVSFDESQVVTFNSKFVCGFRNGDCATGSRSENTVDSPHEFIINWIVISKNIKKVTEVIDVENGRVDNSRVLRWIVSYRMELLCFVDEVFDLEYIQVQVKVQQVQNYVEPLPLVKAAFVGVSGEESLKNATTIGATKPTATAFVAKTFDNKRWFSNNNNKGSGSNSNSYNRGPNPNLKCTNCNKIGHTVNRCFELIVYPADYVKRNFIANARLVSSNNASADVQYNNVRSNNATTINSLVSLSNEKLARLMSLLNDNGLLTANANMARWIVDYGENQHMTVSTKFLINVVDISNLGLTVGHPTGTQALITKNGDLKINNDITLYDVLVVLKYTDLRANITVRIDNQCNGLYLFDVDNACKIVSNACKIVSNSSIASCFVPKTLWHQRLSHPANQVLDVLKTTLNLDSHSATDHLFWVYMLKGKDDVYDFIGNDNSKAIFIEENNTHPEGNVSYKTYFVGDFYKNSEFNSETKDLPVNIVRKSSRQTKLPTSLNVFIIDGKVKYGVERVVNYANLSNKNLCFAYSLNKNVEPTCYNDAILNNDWIDAMNAKIEALIKNHTWIITDLLREGIDFDEIFSLVVKMSVVRCLIALSVKNKWPIFQLDVNNEFLYGDLEEDVYMTIPQGFYDKDNKNKSKNNKFIALLVYVDDIVVTGNCVNEINQFKTFLKSKFNIKDLGSLKYFLGIEVIKTEDDLCLSQRKYYLELLKEYGLLGCKPISTLIEPNSVLSYIATSDDPFLDNITSAFNVLKYLRNTPGKSIKYVHSD
uniref:Reverse transcriptase Ty1/copia-type domain-containing protein n=1 Tax=Tanacetum cinerariifolium TaxID=118510 RepID=A0A6L2J0H5_TANCI|nr:hypothetical protein [Tanacetum cinerariifolium]